MYTDVYESVRAGVMFACVRYENGDLFKTVQFKHSWRGLGWLCTEMRVNFSNYPATELTCSTTPADCNLVATNYPGTLEQFDLPSDSPVIWVEDMSLIAQTRFGLQSTNIYG